MYQAMRERSRFIDRDTMPQASDQDRSENVLREIETLLTEVDTELADLDKDQDDFDARVELLKQRLIAPSFLIGTARDPDVSPPLVSIVIPTRDRAGFIGDAI